MDYQYKNGWVFLRDVDDGDGVKIEVSVGTATLMSDGNFKRRAKHRLDTLGPYDSKDEGIAAGKSLAEEWIDKRGGVVR